MYRVQTAASMMEGNLWSHVSLDVAFFISDVVSTRTHFALADHKQVFIYIQVVQLNSLHSFSYQSIDIYLHVFVHRP